MTKKKNPWRGKKGEGQGTSQTKKVCLFVSRLTNFQSLPEAGITDPRQASPALDKMQNVAEKPCDAQHRMGQGGAEPHSSSQAAPSNGQGERGSKGEEGRARNKSQDKKNKRKNPLDSITVEHQGRTNLISDTEISRLRGTTATHVLIHVYQRQNCFTIHMTYAALELPRLHHHESVVLSHGLVLHHQRGGCCIRFFAISVTTWKYTTTQIERIYQ